MKNEIKHSVHHIVPKSIGGSNQENNLKAIDDNFHKAFHRIFKNRSPVRQMEMLTVFNASALTLEFQVRVNELIKDAQDLEFVYKKGILVPNKEFIKSYK